MENYRCRFCKKHNTQECKSECGSKWNINYFVPKDEVKKYFSQGDFDTMNDKLVPTHSINIDGNHYCPYCGESMFPIQDKNSPTYATIGYTCICDGARSELEYNERLKELREKQQEELRELQNAYKDKLTFCCDKLFEIHQKREKEHFRFMKHTLNHFSTLNGEKFGDIQDIVR